MSKIPGVTRTAGGKIKYRDKTFDGFNKPKRSDKPDKKGMVLAKEGDTVKLIHFGDAGMGHNYSPEARRAFKARHAQNIERGKLSAAYWADKVLWNPSTNNVPGIPDSKQPPKGQKLVRGKK